MAEDPGWGEKKERVEEEERKTEREKERETEKEILMPSSTA